ncbi:hypothetical protein ACQR10_28800 [Bradyrhizobium sp. HKCCYLRH2060]|uniref:hypothetical protein n=1 Tax=Bradyrhizobium TaxID=374 RepID=UPI002916D323|nr:hypothetical protein [Bradyrhizobium sp. SZCCHNR3003]
MPKGDEPTIFVTKDDRQVVIASGGEQISPNSYGFEIEFCSHNSWVFQFTHVEAADIELTVGDSPEAKAVWTIETDSDNVFELTTGKTWFSTVADAYLAKDRLAEYLVASVSGTSTQKYVTFLQWKAALASEAFDTLVKNFFGKALKKAEAKNRSSTQVLVQLNENNIDDTTNVGAALWTFAKNEGSPQDPQPWNDYLNNILLGRSQKDPKEGFSSQVNMPMTLQGYFLYQMAWKLPRENLRFSKGVARPSWIWLNVMAEVYSGYMSLLTKIYKDVGQIDPAKVPVELNMTIAELKKSAFVFLVTNKVVCGAMGALSEMNQLKLQEIAYAEKSTLIFRDPYPFEEQINSYQVDQFPGWWRWLPFHSYLKDLTALWFKAALLDVISKEDFDRTFCGKLGEVLLSGETAAIWLDALAKFQREYIEKAGKKPYSRLATYDVKSLCKAINMVEKALGAMLLNASNPSTDLAFNLPPPNARPFLDYSRAPKWEGRYDTMWSSIKLPGSSPSTGDWTYLVEHRRH